MTVTGDLVAERAGAGRPACRLAEGGCRAGPAGRRRAIWIPGIALFVAAAVLRILVAGQRDGIEVDGIVYLRNAQALWEGVNGLDVLHPPLYSLVLAPFLGLSGDPERVARLTSAVLGALWVWPTLWLARETTDEDVAWSAGALVAFFPAAVEAATRVLSEAVYGLCLAAFLAALVRAANRPGLGLASFAGLMGGLSTLARPEGMGYLLLAWGVLLAAPWAFRSGWSARRAAMAVLVLTIVWLAIIAPYAALVRKHTGHWHWSGKFGITLAWGESVGQEQPALFIEQLVTELPREGLPRGFFAYAAEKPWSTLRRLAINLHHLDKYVAPELLHTGGIVLLALGLIRLRWRRTPGAPEWFLPLALLPPAGILLFLASPRYFTPLLPIIAIMAAIGLARLRRKDGTPDSPRRISAGHILLALVLVSFVPWNARHWFRHDSAGVEKAAALWLREAVGLGAVFIGRHPRVAFYAEAREVPLAGRSLDELLAAGRKAGAQFLIVDNIHIPVLRPDLLPLAGGDPGRHTRDMALAHIAEDRSGNRVVLYRIRPVGVADSTGGSQ